MAALIWKIIITKMAAFRNGVGKFSGKLFPQLSFSKTILIRGASTDNSEKNSHVEPRNFEVTRDPEEWKYLTRLLNKTTVPAFQPKLEYPSQWVPPSDKGKEHPYFVDRTKNHMLPLYLDHHDRGQLKVTVVKKIHGDIWQLHEELKKHVETMGGKKVASQVLESNSQIKFKGDRFHWVEQFLLSKGF